VILGLLLVFLSSRVWTNVDRANMAASQEATAILELRRVTDELLLAVAGSIQDGLGVYLKWVQQDDWPSMMSGNGSISAKLPGLVDAMKALVDYNATVSGQRSMQEQALAAIGKVRDARRARILQSRSFVGPGQWLVVLVLYFHLLLLFSTIHIRRSVSMAVTLWMFSSAFAICFVLLLMYDRPSRSGGLTVGFVGIETSEVG
jgi:hypothetical protein